MAHNFQHSTRQNTTRNHAVSITLISYQFPVHTTNRKRHRTLLVLTDWSLEMTPVPLHGASSRTRSNPDITFRARSKWSALRQRYHKFGLVWKLLLHIAAVAMLLPTLVAVKINISKFIFFLFGKSINNYCKMSNNGLMLFKRYIIIIDIRWEQWSNKLKKKKTSTVLVQWVVDSKFCWIS